MPMDDELLYRQMPHSLEAEQAVLGSMLIDAECVKDVMEKLRPEEDLRGIDGMVLMLSITLSPCCPSPRVRALTSTPCSYHSEIDNPSYLSSHTISAVEGNLRTHSSISSRE